MLEASESCCKGRLQSKGNEKYIETEQNLGSGRTTAGFNDTGSKKGKFLQFTNKIATI